MYVEISRLKAWMMEDSKLYGNRLAASRLAISPNSILYQKQKSHSFDQDNKGHMRLDLNAKAWDKAGLMINDLMNKIKGTKSGWGRESQWKNGDNYKIKQETISEQYQTNNK